MKTSTDFDYRIGCDEKKHLMIEISDLKREIMKVKKAGYKCT